MISNGPDIVRNSLGQDQGMYNMFQMWHAKGKAEASGIARGHDLKQDLAELGTKFREQSNNRCHQS